MLTIIGLNILKFPLGGKAPQVYNVVLVVPPVQMYIIGIDQQEAKQDEQDLYGAFTAIHKVSVEDVRLLRRRETILSRPSQHVNGSITTWQCAASHVMVTL